MVKSKVTEPSPTINFALTHRIPFFNKLIKFAVKLFKEKISRIIKLKKTKS